MCCWAALRMDHASYKHLSDNQFAQFQDLILRNGEVFALDDTVIGCAPAEAGIFHVINTGDATPVSQKPYKLSHHEWWLKVEIKRLLRLGVIRPSKSAWMSPVILVKKPDGGLRLTVDMRALNKTTLPDPYPLPTVDDIHSGMGGSSFFSQMDCVTGIGRCW
jgi:hypothetical protein